MRRWMNASMLLLLLTTGSSPSWAGDGFDYYINYLEGRDWPKEHDPVYAEDVQGIAHSDDHWFITQQGDYGTTLFKIHVSEDLASPAIAARTFPGMSGLTALGYDKFKAMDSYKNPYDGKWYLLIAVEGVEGAGLAVYTDDLYLRGADSLSPQSTAGWCAINEHGYLYSGENNTDYLNRYTIDWERIAAGDSVDVTHVGTVTLRNESGPMVMNRYQGGDFTPEGDKLYIVTGYFGVPTTGHGIHVFDVRSDWRRVTKSGQSGLFAFQYNPQCDWDSPVCEEPEGLTFWDLNDGRSPNVSGELHVLLLDNDGPSIPNGDDVYLKHYSQAIWVDNSYPSYRVPIGDPTRPDVTVADGLARVVDGLELWIRSGDYNESITITKKVKIANPSSTGSAVIGRSTS